MKNKNGIIISVGRTYTLTESLDGVYKRGVQVEVTDINGIYCSISKENAAYLKTFVNIDKLE